MLSLGQARLWFLVLLPILFGPLTLGQVHLGDLIRTSDPRAVVLPDEGVMAGNEAFEFAAQGFADALIGKELVKRIALIIAGWPHLLDIGISVHGITGDGKKTVAGLDFKPLGAKGMGILGQVRRNARQDFDIALN